jgi:hypothetical protein
MFAAPSVSVAGSRPGQEPAKLSPSRTVRDPPACGVVELEVEDGVDDPQPARAIAVAAATTIDDSRKAVFSLASRLKDLGIT